jgi:hypothetical protein
MTVAGITVTDPDSLMAAADALHFRESYGDYCARMADELAAESAISADDADEPADPCDGLYLLVAIASTDPEPVPPSPAAPALRVLPQPTETPCVGCNGYGVVPMVPRTDHSGDPCWMCNGSGSDAAPASTVVDPTEHMRRIGQTGGLTTYALYGSHHMREIGRAGYAVTVARHGRDYALALIKGKGWEPKPRPDLLADLRAGRELAELAKAA